MTKSFFTAIEANDNSIQSDVVIVKTHPVGEDGLKWHCDTASPSFYYPHEYRLRFAPVVPSLFLGQFTGRRTFKFDEPIDYLISWSDMLCCVGMIANNNDANSTVPLTVRFGGHWTDAAVKSMYVGCVVRVKAYMELKELHCANLSPVLPLGATKDISYIGIPIPTAFACEWAVVSKPRIVRSLGMLIEDKSYSKEFYFPRGIVRDFEHNQELFAAPEKWPIHQVKELPPVNTTVVINYVEITTPHVIHDSRDKDILMPDYMRNYISRTYSKVHSFVFGWLDLTMQPSRVYE
ncbi:unnamed protein product [Bursaphelenchus okinawaensis]|uniref:Uncharacterized protein n=1 Tax=Bursaphelenchus okinawaensis TaxID=465554 RepID=A0A811LSF0_9BILA|nr:unnamed protein product [Bursaphelenchus okinawaensis]CAG9127230.1 unnamed protein product [Bursaphelenchus okinawaensis]